MQDTLVAPSLGTTAPVPNRASSPTSTLMALATSSASATRPSGARSAGCRTDNLA
ncbi:hypothetical protein AB0E88_27085 [Streptomyces sp. NPDC028635]|uniref:hypothetical protein n=1 Tax=Streptomyces sp. NPDC028635 TaxID=3154800 RepID=UPI0033E5D270